MKKILFPTDFSENANHALKYAVEFASATGSHLTIMNCYELPTSHAGMMKSMKDILRTDSEAGIKETEEFIEKNCVKPLPGYTAFSKYGNLVINIKELIKSENIDLVMMGTKGATGLKSVLIGSNTVDVIKNVNSPVIAIPEIGKFKRLKIVTLAADLKSLTDNKILQPLIEIAKFFKSKIEVLNVVTKGERIVEKQRERENLTSLLSEVDHSFVYVENNDIVEGITNHIQRDMPDLLCMVLRKHNLFIALFRPSITRDIAVHPTVPLMVLHE